MALFGLFGKKSETSQLKKYGERAGNKRGQALDRWDALQALAAMRSAESVEALLPRFNFRVDPSITDEEEKELAFKGVIDAGEFAHAPVRAYLRRAESLAWPLKMLDRLLSPEEVVGELIDVLGDMDTEYERDPSRKIDILGTLEERKDGRIVEAASRFLEDTNETTRFAAAGAIYAQDEAEPAREALLECLCGEESVRVRNRILDGFVARGWDVGDRRDAVASQLTEGYTVDGKGCVSKRG